MKRLLRSVEKGAVNLLLILEAVALIIMIITAIVWNITGKETVEANAAVDERAVQENAVSEDYVREEPESAAEEAETEEEEETEQPEMLSFSEEEVARLFLTTPEGLTGNTELTVTQAGETTEQSYGAYPARGLLYTAANFPEESQAAAMLTRTTEIAEEAGQTGLLLMMREEDLGTEAERYRGYGINAVLINTKPEDVFLSAGELEEKLSEAEENGLLPVLLAPFDSSADELTHIREEAGYDGSFATEAADIDEAEQAVQTGFDLIFTGDSFRALYQQAVLQWTE